jgi:1-acyl-sn-glycerol-3-phosphate acyltransferase
VSSSAGLFVRSLLFNVVFYVNISVRMIAALPTIMMPYSALHGVLRHYASSTLWFLRVICGIGVEWRGREKLPRGAYLVACKHQSTWETLALFLLLPDPTYVLKRELMRLPLFGWLATKAQMIPIDRGSHAKALTGMLAAARQEAARGRQIVIFPEGTRRQPGANPQYLPGAAFLYTDLGLPCVPIALNSGLFWPRQSWLRRPGTIVAEVLDPIPAGLDKREFLRRMQSAIEGATARLVAEGEHSDREQSVSRD